MENSPHPKNFEEAFAQKIAAETAAATAPTLPSTKKKALLITIIVAMTLIILGLLAYLILFMENSPIYLGNKIFGEKTEEIAKTEEKSSADASSENPEENPAATPVNSKKFYSIISGEEIADEALNSSPTFCVQIPNGMDGARPQAGLNEAKIVFEAIAEAGITRFAAIFQNPTVSAIGPIRSLRIYYFDWDVPFDCTVVHAGGASDAISALNSSSLKNHDENYSYMWRSSKNGNLNRMWNNLFTSSAMLKKFNEDRSYLSSDVKSFPRFTPAEESLEKIDAQVVEKLDIDTEANGNTDTLEPKVTKINIKIGNMPTFNPVYTYNKAKNSYDRSYESGAAHETYNCVEKEGEITPEVDCGDPVQLSSKVVIAMVVKERKQSDGYHEDISTLGVGDAFIFENGTVIRGSWEKNSKSTQIVFKDADDKEIKLNPGQTWITAVPETYGGTVDWE